MARRKVLFFLNNGDGGAEHISVNISKMLPREQYEVKYVIIGSHTNDITKFFHTTDKIIHLRIRNMWDFLICKMTQLLKKECPDIVFCSMMHYNSRLIIASRIAGHAKVIIRSNNSIARLRWDKILLMSLTYHHADYIISQQEEMTQEIVSFFPMVDPNKVVTLHNPVDIESIELKTCTNKPFTNEGQTNYVCVARIHNNKGQDILCKAFAELCKTKENAHLWLVGKYNESDPYFQHCLSIIQASNCTEKVTFVGFDENPYRWMKHCDCFVLPSRLEGLPNALVEAQYLGRPCVAATCIPVIDRIIKEGVNGYKVPSEDYLAMAEAMIKAPALGEIKMTYKSATKEDFIQLFK